MGDIADDLISIGMDMETDEGEEWDGQGLIPRHRIIGSPPHCKYCKQKYLHWKNSNGEWRLYDDAGRLHTCKERLNEKEVPKKKLKIFVFDCHGHNALAYSCSEPGDNSGKYVRLEDLGK